MQKLIEHDHTKTHFNTTEGFVMVMYCNPEAEHGPLRTNLFSVMPASGDLREDMQQRAQASGEHRGGRHEEAGVRRLRGKTSLEKEVNSTVVHLCKEAVSTSTKETMELLIDTNDVHTASRSPATMLEMLAVLPSRESEFPLVTKERIVSEVIRTALPVCMDGSQRRAAAVMVQKTSACCPEVILRRSLASPTTSVGSSPRCWTMWVSAHVVL